MKDRDQVVSFLKLGLKIQFPTFVVSVTHKEAYQKTNTSNLKHQQLREKIKYNQILVRDARWQQYQISYILLLITAAETLITILKETSLQDEIKSEK